MSETNPAGGTARIRASDLLALGFGTTVAMWAVGYFSRLPGAELPSWILMVLLLGCLGAGGYFAGRWTDRGWRGGLLAGLLAAVLNLLVLGSLLSGDQPGRVIPSALWWVPGSLLLSAAIAAVGAAAGSRARATPATPLTRTGAAPLAWVTAAATFLLLVAGGIVTSQEAGLAVVDWPNSYGYNMFLYPLARMTGGIYFEHVHRLLGSLVGVTTLVLTLYLQRVEKRRWVRGLAVGALLLVIAQGIVGGLRVTGHFTLSDNPAVTRPNLLLAVVHGVMGQLFFGTVVALAVVTTPRWRDTSPVELAGSQLERNGGWLLVALLIVQLVLGAVLRHMAGGLLVHITMAVVVILAGAGLGIRLWSVHGTRPPLARLGIGLLILLTLQLILGLSALVATGMTREAGQPPTVDVLLTTAHQATGAVLLAWAVATTLWTHRCVRPAAVS